MDIPLPGAPGRRDNSLKNYTFLTTDIEDSTRRWEQQPEKMRAALALHDAILRAAITQENGEVFKLTGDGFCAAFASPNAAISAAMRAQTDLAAADFGTIGGLPVRMAIDTGLAESRDGDYFGPPLNRVARLLETASGGQILVSSVVAELARGWLPETALLRPVGKRLLTGISRPVMVFEVSCGTRRRARWTAKTILLQATLGAAVVAAAAGWWWWHRPLPQQDQQRALVQALAGIPCALLTVQGNQVTGIINDGASNNAFERAMLSLGPHVRPIVRVTHVDGHFCTVLDTLSSYHSISFDSSTAAQLTLSSGAQPLHTNQIIAASFTMPAYDGYVESDYFSAGSVGHYSLQDGGLTTKPVFANRRQSFSSMIGVVGPPYDTDLLVVIVTPTPLFAINRPDAEETQSTYLAALNDAMESAAAYGEKISISAVQVITLP